MILGCEKRLYRILVAIIIENGWYDLFTLAMIYVYDLSVEEGQVVDGKTALCGINLSYLGLVWLFFWYDRYIINDNRGSSQKWVAIRQWMLNNNNNNNNDLYEWLFRINYHSVQCSSLLNFGREILFGRGKEEMIGICQVFFSDAYWSRRWLVGLSSIEY